MGRPVTVDDNEMGMEKALARLRQSFREKSSVDMSFSCGARMGDASLRAFVDALRVTLLEIRSVSFDSSAIDENSASPETVELFLRELGSIPSLAKLSWQRTRPQTRQQCIQRMTMVLSRARRLERLHCYSCSAFQGTVQDYHNFASVLESHPKLHAIQFLPAIFPRGLQPGTANLLPAEEIISVKISPVLEAIATIPNLAVFHGDCWLPPPPPPHLVEEAEDDEEDEDEDDMDDVDDTFQPAIQAMKSISGHSRLQQITIYGPSLVAAAPELHTNATLRFLKVKLGMIKRRTRSNNTFEGQVLADVVRSAPSLATLVLTVGHEALRCRIDGQILHVIQALQENTTITKLDLPYHPKNHDIQEAMIDMLQENNMTLTEINVLLSSDNDNAAEDETFLQKQEFFLRLNRLGRKRLLQLSPADRRPWIETLATVSNDVSSLFYFLSKNPTLCSHVATE
ncbi:expressed unknown protein [Seminavis robusta]|uniref:Uncharacterized protein n=1 Tax=Seminavis robusta TaxID=568900 RepID=A0A9N8EV08_9STRA|nr:expressed unknown protein [Seminavis robusta]|eukprot:Sro1767_g296310.1 n/a (456) ;mRNA; f:17206-18573